jgi:hypothetical protein
MSGCTLHRTSEEGLVEEDGERRTEKVNGDEERRGKGEGRREKGEGMREKGERKGEGRRWKGGKKEEGSKEGERRKKLIQE